MTASSIKALDSLQLERVFADCFTRAFHTQLVGGADEPLYRPAPDSQGESLIFYREDYFASALHEVAHWCIAGEGRRRQMDFGYWYTPDGRSPQQQRAFENVEYKPQALEWFFSKACGMRFRVSVDNLQGRANETDDTEGFQRRVLAQACAWQVEAMPERAQTFYRALCVEFGTDKAPAALEFNLAELH